MCGSVSVSLSPCLIIRMCVVSLCVVVYVYVCVDARLYVCVRVSVYVFGICVFLCMFVCPFVSMGMARVSMVRQPRHAHVVCDCVLGVVNCGTQTNNTNSETPHNRNPSPHQTTTFSMEKTTATEFPEP